MPGTFSFNDPDTTPGPGTHIADVTFTPDDTAAYFSVAGTVHVEVLTQFQAWAGGAHAAFDHDSRGDGMADGMAWLLGAASPSHKTADLMPKARENNGNLNEITATIPADTTSTSGKVFVRLMAAESP